MIKTHNLLCEKLGREDLYWEKAVENQAKIVRLD